MQQNYRQSWYGDLSRESIQPWKKGQRNNATRVFTDGSGSLKKGGYDATKLQAISIRGPLSRIALTLKSRPKEQCNKGFQRWTWQPKKLRVWYNRTTGNLDTETTLFCVSGWDLILYVSFEVWKTFKERINKDGILWGPGEVRWVCDIVPYSPSPPWPFLPRCVSRHGHQG